MTTSDPAGAPDEKSQFTGEEGGSERSTPRKDLGAAVVITALAVAAMVYSLRLEVPTTIYTAPGLFPFLTGLSLLVMAIGLGAKAVRDGGTVDFPAAVSATIARYLSDRESQQTLLLLVVLVFYVVVVGQIGFDLRLPTPFFVFQLSSWETISIPVLAAVLWYFWRGAVWQCVVLSTLMIFALAGIFRYAFHILLPAAG